MIWLRSILSTINFLSLYLLWSSWSWDSFFNLALIYRSTSLKFILRSFLFHHQPDNDLSTLHISKPTFIVSHCSSWSWTSPIYYQTKYWIMETSTQLTLGNTQSSPYNSSGGSGEFICTFISQQAFQGDICVWQPRIQVERKGDWMKMKRKLMKMKRKLILILMTGIVTWRPVRSHWLHCLVDSV